MAYFFGGRPGAIWAGAIGVCILVLVGAHVLNIYLDEKSEIPAFRTEVLLNYQAKNSDLLSPWMIGYKRGGKNTASPLNFLLWTRIVNMQQVQSKIANYRVQVSASENGPWKTLNAIGMTGRQLYAISNENELKEALELTIDDDLYTILRDRTLQPRDTVEGWMIFERYDLNWTNKTWFFKFYFRDTAGVETNQIIKAPRGDGAPGEVNLANPPLKAIGRRDISGFHFRYFSSSFRD